MLELNSISITQTAGKLFSKPLAAVMSHDSDNFYIKSNNNKLSHVVISY